MHMTNEGRQETAANQLTKASLPGPGTCLRTFITYKPGPGSPLLVRQSCQWLTPVPAF